MKFYLTVFSIIVSCLSGCSFVSHGRYHSITRDQLEVIQINISSKDDIIKEFGEPQKIVYKRDGVEVYIYQHGNDKAIGIPFVIYIARAGGAGQILSITFKDDIVVDYEYVVDQRRILK